jgi:hypothetical protein
VTFSCDLGECVDDGVVKRESAIPLKAGLAPYALAASEALTWISRSRSGFFTGSTDTCLRARGNTNADCASPPGAQWTRFWTDSRCPGIIPWCSWWTAVRSSRIMFFVRETSCRHCVRQRADNRTYVNDHTPVSRPLTAFARAHGVHGASTSLRRVASNRPLNDSARDSAPLWPL